MVKSSSPETFISHHSFVISPRCPIGEDLDSVVTEPTSDLAGIDPFLREEWNQGRRQEVDDLIANKAFTLADLSLERKKG